MTTRANLSQAIRLSNELDNVTRALAIVATPGFNQTLQVSTSDFSSGAQVTTSVSGANLTTMLTARQTAINTALAALGVT